MNSRSNVFALKTLGLAMLAVLAGTTACTSRNFNRSVASDARTASSPSEGSGLPLRDFSLLAQPAKVEKVVRVKTARVVYANYALIRRDFAQLETADEKAIDAWLEAHTFVSLPQAAQEEFNTRIETAPSDVKAYRPRDYGRALVIAPFPDAGLDSKGSGSDNPRYDWEDGDPRTGSCTLGEAIREYLYTQAVTMVLSHAKADFAAVGAYAVMSGGFDVIHRSNTKQEQGRSPAGFVFRQAQRRFENPEAKEVADKGRYFLWDEKNSLKAERILRRYGLTSEGGTGRAPGAIEGGINIQGTAGFKAILDFGNFVVVDRFVERPVPHFYGTKPLLAPGGDFPQPDPSVSLPVDSWGPFTADKVDSKLDKPWVYSHQTASAIAGAFAAGRWDEGRAIARSHYRNLLEPVAKKLGAALDTAL